VKIGEQVTKNGAEDKRLRSENVIESAGKMFERAKLNQKKIVELADLARLQTSYIGADDNYYEIDTDALLKVLSSLGIACSTPGDIERSIEKQKNKRWLTPIKKTVIEIAEYASEVELYLPSTVFKKLDNFDLRIVLEEGASTLENIQIDQISRSLEERVVDDVEYEKHVFKLPENLPLGYHTIVLDIDDLHHKSSLICTPMSAPVPSKQMYGFMAHFYSMRSRTSWGVGDFQDLKMLTDPMKSETGADFCLINPIHADTPSLPQTPSPYLPTSKRWINPIYIRPQLIEEFIFSSSKTQKYVEQLARMGRSLSNEKGNLNRDAVWSLKKAALRLVFSEGIKDSRRQAKFVKFINAGGSSLAKFALWCALVDDFGFNGAFQQESPNLEKHKAYAKDNEEELYFYMWLQWIAFEQLEVLQNDFKAKGANIGLIADLAVGVHPEGADVWGNRSMFVEGASVGAPPDVYNQMGQDWSQPPLSPEKLEATGYRFYIDQVRQTMRHAGAVRIDHALGLFRLWYVPRGATAREGAYVLYDHDAMVGILALEALRNNCYVIGEDMGTRPPHAAKYLKNRGILGTSVLFFEREKNGDPRSPEMLRELCFSSVTTHDIPPTIGYLEGEHVKLREELGLLTEDPAQVYREQQKDLQKVKASLIQAKLLDDNKADDDLEVSISLQKSLFSAPSLLLGFAVTDFVGEYRAQNQPGTSDEYPNWRVPLENLEGELVYTDNIYDNKCFRHFMANLEKMRPKR
jgi:4-alpha-glucanotransferase